MTTVTETRLPQAIDGRKEAIEKLKEGLAQGKHWFIALLEAMALWTLPEEVNGDQTYHYVIGGEAFDWLALAQRLLEETGQAPQTEIESLLFDGKPPLQLSPREMRSLLGSEKYRAYLNYYYGVLVEEALVLAVVEDVRKKWWCRGYNHPDAAVMDQAFQNLYGSSVAPLWESFCEQKHFRRKRQITIHQLKEFTYWLFKRRLATWDKARIASDTRKGLENLHRQRNGRVAPVCR
ncbi:MAG: hypothetical protein HY671_10355 [Chloroflexi bacterium]|nr:hypothetical protein [Chloroflexota bacterium]